MLWAFEILLSMVFGYRLITVLIENGMNPVQRFFAGIPLGFFTFAWITWFVTYKSPLRFVSAIPAIIIMIGSSILFKRIYAKKKISPYIKFTKFEFFTLLGFSLFFLWVMNVSMLKDGNRSKGAGYGDLPFHLNIISGFVTGCNHQRDSFFKINTVFYSGEKLAYPYMTNFFTAVLIGTGSATMRGAFFVPSFLMSLSLIVGMYYLGILFHKDHLACLVAMFTFLNLGGFGFIRLLDPTYVGEGDLIHNWGNDVYEYWFHPIMHVLVPQRASLWSMPLCYWCLIVLIKGIKIMKWQYFLLASLYVATTPLVQVHSYVGLAQWAIVFAALNFPWKDKSKWMSHVYLWAIFGIVANVLAFPQFTPFMKRLSTKQSDKGSGFLLIDPIWNSSGRPKHWTTPIKLWWRGLGVFAFISLVGGWCVMNNRQLILYIPSFVVFLITNIIRYQPWEMDNSKVFYASWIPLGMHVYGLFIAKLLRKSHWRFFAITFIVVACFSSCRFFFIAMKGSNPIFEDDSVEFGHWAAENTPVDSIWLTSQWHGNPVLTFAGRQSYMGYGGWLLSHGLDYFGRNDMTGKMSREPENLEPFREYNITYVVSHHGEFSAFRNVLNEKGWTKIYNNNNFECWKYDPTTLQ